MDRFAALFVGMFFIVVGFNVFFISDYRIPWWGQYTYGPYPSVIGILFMIGGVLLVYTGIKNIIKKKKS